MKTYRLILESEHLAYCTHYKISITDHKRAGQTILEIQAENFSEAQKMISFQKNIKGKLTIL